jgi:gliding motility-associated-like protein
MLATSVEGCTNANGYIPVTVNVRPRPIVTLTSDAVLGYAYQGQLITFTAEPFGYQNYIFYINNNQVQNSLSNAYQNNSLNNNDLVSVSATENGCESLDKAEIKMEIKPLSNAFTPNNDGTNDLFLRGLDLQIINRWGQELYKGKEGWDGTFQGKVVSPGTYFYIVTFKDFSGTETKLNGPVTLIGE